jgi:hypothetical protein
MMVQSSLLNWPKDIDRTPPQEREECTKFSVGLSATRSQLGDEMDRMGVDEWHVDEVSGAHGDPGVVLRWQDGAQEYAVANDQYTTKTANLREVYLWVQETRKSDQRPVKTARDAFAAAQLPSGDGGGVVVAGARPAHEVLGVEPDAPDQRVRAAYEQKVKEAHPDRGGSEEAFKRVEQAYEVMTGR